MIYDKSNYCYYFFLLNIIIEYMYIYSMNIVYAKIIILWNKYVWNT